MEINRSNDTIVTRAHREDIFGGLGADHFVFNTALGPDNIDIIGDFDVYGGDMIDLSASIFKQLAGKTDMSQHFRLASQQSVGGDDFIVYDNTTGQLFYDASGSGSGSLQQFVLLMNQPQDLTGSQFVVV